MKMQKPFVLSIVNLVWILLLNCNQVEQSTLNVRGSDEKIDSANQKRTSTSTGNLLIYRLPYYTTKTLYDTIYRYYPIAWLNDTLAILEGSRTLTFLAFKSIKGKNIYLRVNDSTSFSFDNILDQIITNKDESFFRKDNNYEELRFKPEFKQNGFKIVISNEPMLSYGLLSREDSIFLDKEGHSFGAIMRDNFLRFSDKFYVGITSDKFFENWGLKPMAHGNFTVFLEMNAGGLNSIWRLENGIPKPYIDIKNLSKKYKRLMNYNFFNDNNYITGYQLIFKKDTLKIIYANMYRDVN